MNTFIFFSIIGLVYGQSFPVDKNIIKDLKRSGITLEQAKEIIKDQAIVPDNQLDNIDEVSKEKLIKDRNKLKDELNSAYKTDISNKIDSDNNEPEDVTNPSVIKTSIVPTITIANEYFGYDIFNGNPEKFQASISEAIDPEYTIAPGDEVIIMLWGETELNDTFIIEKDGYLFIPNIGQVFVNGLTLSKLEKKLFKLLKRVHSSLDPKMGNPSTFLDVSLGSLVLRPVRVFVLGEVIQPGSYSVKSSTSLFTSLYYFNGPSIKGSLRDIRLLRKGKLITKIDFYDYLLSGSQVNDTRLQRDDVIFISKRGKTVKVSGEIHRSAIFEMKNDEGLIKLIKMAGGIKPTTYLKRLQIKRIMPLETRLVEGINRTIIDIDLATVILGNKDYTLYDGDEITFFKITDELNNVVTINGSVIRPGEYDLGNGLRISELIAKADGILGNTYLDRVDIERTNNDYSKSHLDIDLGKALNAVSEHDIFLKTNDVVTVHSLSDMLYKTNVSISGHVKSPGEKIYKEGMQVYDLIFMGGGFENKDHLSKTYFERAELTRYNPETIGYNTIKFRLDSVLAGKGIADMELKMGDEIRIYSLSDIKGEIENTVTIQGEVKRSGVYKLYENMTIYDLLFMAIGFDDKIQMEKIFSERVDIIRYDDDFVTQKILSFSLIDLLDKNNSVENYKLKPGDEVRVYSNDMFTNDYNIKIEGRVLSPGDYSLKSNMKLKDLILEAGGVDPDLYRFRAEVSRIDPNNLSDKFFAEILTFDITNESKSYLEETNENNKLDLLLKPYDVISIRPDPYFSEQRKVVISGYVYYPGEYSIRGPNEKVTDIIDRAGGLRPEAYPLSSLLTRNGKKIKLSFEKIIKQPKSKYNFDVMEGDLIEIGSKPNLVIVEGQVHNPGNYKYMKGHRLKDYIKVAGGLTKDASRYGTYVLNPDGSSTRWSAFSFSPQIKDGAKIIIASKEKTEPFSYTDYVTNMSEFFADISQAWLMVILALRS